jgi:hypothetical protein
MNTQKLLVIAAIVCLLVGASGAAMAEELRECPNGFISGGQYETIALDLEFQDCVIVGVTVTTQAGVRVINPGSFIMMMSYVKGVVRVEKLGGDIGSFAILKNNVVDGYNILTKNLNEADVRGNTVVDGNIRVIDDSPTPGQYAEVIQNWIKGQLVVKGNVSADVKGNRTIEGNIRVNDNLAADVKGNRTTGGRITCRDNTFLDASGNEASGGNVNCSRGNNGNGP